ncbi:MAG: hypothetical protein K5668_09320 [Lachnospiraceae bacterium]|nr:hypothetical protein [Lachnospiraceae bacterium]
MRSGIRKSIISIIIIILLIIEACPVYASSRNSYKDDKPRTFTIFRDTGMIVEKTTQSSIPQRGWTAAVPEAYFLPAEKPGAIVSIKYGSKDYAGDGRSITKTAKIYLPYGYNNADIKTRYNIFYMMHGLECTADQLFFEGGGKVKNMLDNMIADGVIPPVIVVAATFDADNSPQDFARSDSEVRQFHQDFANDLMPAVEGKFHTYAASSSKKDLMASREHRAFGGFSLGAVTTWFQYCYNSDYIKYFAPMSASCWYFGGYGETQAKETCDFFEKLIAEQHLNEKGYYIYACTGTHDSLFGQMNTQMSEMLSRSDVFTPDHVSYYLKSGGIHDFNASVEYLYNALPVFYNRQ